MAKISARGDSEHARWRHPETGAELVLTMYGRLLQKTRGGSFSIVRSYFDVFSGQRLDRASEEARRLGMERV